ncbi:PTS transporter subunit EIIC [Lactiplantibacillus daoliensis]|uniref:Permease IIC component n=1 Tax=Lactiplantibacillus daoliensis TaxID=2559916 RepID=A0ABW1UGT4_9LACO|nr:PTS transporter subunit EIIC [Lactiplantibacillus daoliensis]
MSLIKQFANQLLNWETWLNRRRYFHALRDTLTLLFPLVLIGAFINVFNQAIFQKSGFIAQIYHLNRWFPGFKALTTYTTMLSLTLNGVIAVVAAFTAANFAVRAQRRDNLLAGLTAAVSFCLLNFNYAAFTKQNQPTSSRFLEQNLGSQGIFLALLVGLITGWLFNHLAFKTHTHQLIETRTHLLSRAKENWLPMTVTLLGFSLLSYGISFVSKNGLNGLFYTVFRLPFFNPGSAFLNIVSVTFLSNFFWVIGIIGPIDFSGNSSVSTVQNLEYALQHGSAWGAPNPITLHTIFDSFANVGGPGMTLALVIAILWRSHNADFRTVAKASWLPSLFNFNQPLLVGLPIMFSPILAIPFLMAPLASLLITWSALKLGVMPPVVYPVGRTMPGFLVGWLGSGGDWRALLVSLVNLSVATAIYLPFILLENRVVEGRPTDET